MRKVVLIAANGATAIIVAAFLAELARNPVETLCLNRPLALFTTVSIAVWIRVLIYAIARSWRSRRRSQP